MPEDTVPPVVVVAPPPAPPPAPPVPPPAPTPETVVEPPAVDPNWFKPRLDQAKRAAETALLATLGVKDTAEATALLAAARAAEEAQKSELQKKDEKIKSLESVAVKVAEYEQTIKTRAEYELSQLTDAQRTSVAALAGADMAKTLMTIDALKPTWVVAKPAVVVEAKPAEAPPVNSAPPPKAPGGEVPGSPPDHKAVHKSLKDSGNGVAAAAYLNKFQSFIYPRT